MKKQNTTYERRRAARPYKMPRTAKTVIFRTVLLLVILLAFSLWGSRNDKDVPPMSPESGVECFQYVQIPDSVPQQVVQYEGFLVSFNSEYHIPNYSAWELTGAEAEGTNPRKSKFYCDAEVDGCPGLDDYRGSGFDRGHLAPAADMKWSEKAMDDCHSLANICPQEHTVNSGIWSTIEKKCRHWARRDSAIIVVCGPILSDEMPQTIGDGVKVPRRFFKVVLAPFANPPRSIAFIVPNYQNSLPLDALVHTVDEVEEITGWDFFHCLPDSVEEIVESRANMRLWDKAKR